MRIPYRIVVPVAAALVLVAGLLVVFFIELDDARAYLAARLSGGTGSVINTKTVIDLPDGGDESLLHLRRGDLHALRGEWESAADEYAKAANNGGGIVSLRKLAQAQLQQRDIRGARETLDRLRREGARPEDLVLLESVILLRTGEMEKARDILNASDDSPHKHYGLALLAIAADDHETAKTELLLVSAGWEPVLRSYAKTLSAAYEEYALFPQSPQTHLQTLLGRALADVGECELGLPILGHVTQIQGDYRDAWIVQGYCELTTGRMAEAVHSLEQAYALDPEKPEIQYFLARAYAKSGDHSGAVTYLQYALRNGFAPESEVRRLLAVEALETGNASLALEQYERLTQLPDADLDIYTSYVAAAITAGKNEEAYTKAVEATTKWPDESATHELRGWAAQVVGKTDEARAEFEEAVRLDPSSITARERLKNL